MVWLRMASINAWCSWMSRSACWMASQLFATHSSHASSDESLLSNDERLAELDASCCELQTPDAKGFLTGRGRHIQEDARQCLAPRSLPGISNGSGTKKAGNGRKSNDQKLHRLK